jgi:DNA-binding winged helix-turn-helix (wHTH) protein
MDANPQENRRMTRGPEQVATYTFGPYRLDSSERLLSRDDTPLALTPKAFDLLVLLVERRGRLVEKHELMTALWPDTIVEESNLAYHVSVLRKLLDQGEDGQSMIQTVPTRGYRFVAPVTISPRTENATQPQGLSVRASPPTLAAPESENSAEGSLVGRVRSARWRLLLPMAILAIVCVGSVLVMVRWSPTTRLPPALLRLSVELGADVTLPSGDATFALSDDGRLLAFVARRPGGVPQLHVRHLDQLRATPLPGTDGARTPFFSPDGLWLAFFADGQLKKVPVTGGEVVTLAAAPNPRGGWWADDGTIVFAPHYRRSLMRVPAVGGPVQLLTTLVEKEITHRWPQVLPGGGAVLYTASTEVNIASDATLVVHRLPSGERTVVHRGGFFGRSVASGHIVYMQGDTLFAAPFDIRRLTVTGPSVRVVDGVRCDSFATRCAVRSVAERSLCLSLGSKCVRTAAGDMDGPHRDNVDLAGNARGLEQPRVLAGRTANRDGHPRRGAQRYLGVRVVTRRHGTHHVGADKRATARVDSRWRTDRVPNVHVVFSVLRQHPVLEASRRQGPGTSAGPESTRARPRSVASDEAGVCLRRNDADDRPGRDAPAD